MPVAFSDRFGTHGQTIELFCGGASEPVLATINRDANKSGSPRIYGRRQLKTWFKDQALHGRTIRVDVVSPTSANLVITE